MRSSELAAMAGVTVRTLRHYHKLGLLPEPPRKDNGYREYYSLGFSLERIKAMLDAEDAQRSADPSGQNAAQTVQEVLDELDQELKRRIADLQEQRRVIAQLKAEGSTPDVSPAHARFLAAYSANEPRPELVRFEKEALALSESLLSPSSMSLLEDFQNILMDKDLVGAYADINRRILTLPADADEEFKQAIIDDAMALFCPIILELDLVSAAESDDELAENLLDTYDREKHSPEQVELIDRIDSAVVDYIKGLFGDETVTTPKNSNSSLDSDLTS